MSQSMNRTVNSPPLQARATGNTGETSGNNWLMQEFKRARERSAQLPPWARPVRIGREPRTGLVRDSLASTASGPLFNAIRADTTVPLDVNP
jgi:hypothetical protein